LPFFPLSPFFCLIPIGIRPRAWPSAPYTLSLIWWLPIRQGGRGRWFCYNKRIRIFWIYQGAYKASFLPKGSPKRGKMRVYKRYYLVCLYQANFFPPFLVRIGFYW
jgi:hypothetical protein